ncbi:tyrosine-type recombinase/integrase [Catellatospora citrea]|uniref:tyrosine-type recombinase/integrase n=1 Tax=Catellatospora citrea TaxID=53366 RepID=UPI0033F1E236
MTSQGTISKRCGCRDQRTAKPLGAGCPQLRGDDGAWTEHGSWRYQRSLPTLPGGPRKQLRRGGFATAEAAEADRDHVTQLLAVAGDNRIAAAEVATAILEAKAGPLPDLDTVRRRAMAGTPLDGGATMAQYLPEWLGRCGVDANTLRGYRSHVDLYLIPYLGHIKVGELKLRHVREMFEAIDERNETIREAKNSPHQHVRDSVRGQRTQTRSTYRRIRATLSTAMTAAISEELATVNPAKAYKIPKAGRPKARVWTPERVAAWKATGEQPSPVMVWTAEQTGRFLDFIADDPLYALFHIIALRGLRRGEAVGLRHADLDLTNRRIIVTNQIAQHGWEPVQKPPKTGAGDRVIALDDYSLDILQTHIARHMHLRQLRGPRWQPNDMLFCDTNGNPLHPATVTDLFNRLRTASGLPPIRLHDLRHGAASIAHAAGADIKSISTQLGHSSITITADTYTEVFAEVDLKSANAAADVIARNRRPAPTTGPAPRQRRTTPTGQTLALVG